MSATSQVLDEIDAEREEQDAKWGQRNHASGTGSAGDEEMADLAREACQTAAAEGSLTWRDILDEEIAEAYAETDPAKIRAELVQSAAVIVAWIECIDRAEAAS
jgi:hypothetical protein